MRSHAEHGNEDWNHERNWDMRKITLGSGIEIMLSDEGVWSSPTMPLFAEELNKSHEVLRYGYSPSRGDPLNYVLQQAANTMGAKQIQFSIDEGKQGRETDAVN